MNILNLYPEDFATDHAWMDVCDCLNISHDAPMICIDFNFATDKDILNKERLSWTYAKLLLITLLTSLSLI